MVMGNVEWKQYIEAISHLIARNLLYLHSIYQFPNHHLIFLQGLEEILKSHSGFDDMRIDWKAPG